MIAKTFPRMLAFLLLAGAPSAYATTWADYDELFPAFPCPDGWTGCELGGEHLTAEPVRSADGTPLPSAARVDFLSLTPTRTFDPFVGLSDYSKVPAPRTAAPPPPPDDIPPPPPEPTGDDDGLAAVDPLPVPPTPTRPDPSPVRPDPSPVRPDPKPEPTTMVRPDPKPEPTMVRPDPKPEPVAMVRPDPKPEPTMVRPEPAPEPAPMVRPEPAPEPVAPEPVGGGEAVAALSGDGSCDDLRALEPMAMMGRLDGATKSCLEDRIKSASLQTDKKAASLVLIQNAWTADKKEWSGLVKRHLSEIDKSDPTLCYKYAQYLQRAGAHQSVIKWADVALENKTYWTGETHTARVYSLYKLKAASANAIWLKAEEDYNANPGSELDEKRGSARSKAKVYAREWLDYAKSAGKDTTKALQYCESAAGNSDYCAG